VAPSSAGSTIIGQNGMELIADITQIFAMYEEIDTQSWSPRCAPDPCDRGGEAGRRCRDDAADIIRQLFQHP